MVLADLMVLESRLERDDQDRKKGKPGMATEEREALVQCQALLNDGKRIHQDPEVAALPVLRMYSFLTARRESRNRPWTWSFARSATRWA